MRPHRVVAIVALGLATLGATAPSAVLRGYTAPESARERAVESQFIDIPSAQNAQDAAAAIGARPHAAGTPADYALAVEMRDRMRSYGIATELEPLTERVDTPRKLVLELAPPADLAQPEKGTKRRRRQAAFPVGIDLAEAAVPGDSASAAREIGLPFNAGSGEGDISAPLVYVNRGLDADYETLAGARIDVRGAVVLVRYGAEFRGLLAQRAQTRGAVAVIFYNDPQDDGAARGLVYPDGPWRPLTAIERGWVGPGIHIPTLPISAANAQVLLGALQGAAGPPQWSGSLPISYPLARGPGRVHLVVKLNHKPTALWNTIGVIPGIHGDQSIVLGAGRDAWVYGVGDDGAGIATLLEVARGLGFLVRGGWRPERTIVIAGWDAETIGSAGSRVFGREHPLNAFAYLNADRPVTGPAFSAAASAALAPAIADAATLVHDPAVPASAIYAGWAAAAPRGVPRLDGPGAVAEGQSMPAQAGTPLAILRFNGPFGVDHSAADTLAYALRWTDPDFGFHRAAAQIYGIVALRLADAGVVPYAFSGYGPLLRRGVAQLMTRADAAGVQLDTTGLRRSIEAFDTGARTFDRGTGRHAGDDVNARQLLAVRLIDTLAYGPAGYTRTVFAEVDTALAAHDRAQVDAALNRAVDGVRAATNALAP